MSQSVAIAMPFTPDPTSFAGWLNNFTGWRDRSLKIKFEHLSKCTHYYYLDDYDCDSGYAYIKDAIRNQKCRVTVSYDGKVNNSNGYEISFNEYDCRNLSVKEKGRDLLKDAQRWWYSQ